MAKQKTKLELAREEAQKALNTTNIMIDRLGEVDAALYKVSLDIQFLFEKIANVPLDLVQKYEQIKRESLNWKQQAEKIEADYKAAAIKNAGKGAAGVGAGVAVAAMGPTAAMGIATTFGVASTGTAISALSGAAATNAALAWLGGGALAAGGGGMAAGEAFLAMAGPVGWAIAGVAIAGTGLLIWKTSGDRKCLEDIFTLVSKRDVKKYQLATAEISERIVRIKQETFELSEAVKNIVAFGQDYDAMTEQQQYFLGSYVNLMMSANQLLVNPIEGLLPKYTKEDLIDFIFYRKSQTVNGLVKAHENVIIALANLFYGIYLTDKEETLLVKSFKGNKEFLKSMDMVNDSMNKELMATVSSALRYKYSRT